MKRHKTNPRTAPPVRNARTFLSHLVILFLMILWQPASAQQANLPVANRVQLTEEEVVRNLVQMNLSRAHALFAYQGIRIYRAEYHGFSGTRSAEMVVNVKYRSPDTKEFNIQSVKGSKLIIDKVFKKLLEAEKEALKPEIQHRSALTEDNYRFTLLGCENGISGAAYVLKVEPRTKDRFLYRGKIWVDAEDLAVVRLEAEPARNPSFWTEKAEIVQQYRKVNDFWLPDFNRSVTTIRLGGHAELTIDYNDYEITQANTLSNLPIPEAEPNDSKQYSLPCRQAAPAGVSFLSRAARR